MLFDYVPQTGDLLLCCGNSPMSRRIVKAQKLFTRLEGVELGLAVGVSHEAMIRRAWPGLESVFEATTLNTWAGKKGVQENKFTEWLANYDGGVFVRRMETTPVGGACYLPERIIGASRRLIGTPYENGIPGMVELLAACIELKWLSGRLGLAERLRTQRRLHCSESVALVLRQVGILRADIRPNKLPPCQWWGTGKLEAYLTGIVSYGRPERLK